MKGMKKKLLFIVALFIGVGFADAAVRDTNAAIRASQSSTVRSDTRTNDSKKNITSRNTKNTSVRNTVTSRAARNNVSVARSGKNVSTVRGAQTVSTARNATPNTRSIKNITARSGTEQIDTTTIFGSSYASCRDAYFTCMDQFCGTANDTYRRCICSSRLAEIQSRERALGHTATQIQDFKDLNIYAIDKSGAEVGAMLSATIGEQTQENAKDTSDSTAQLSNISKILSGTKSKSLSSQGTLDIAGDIKQIWNTTDFADGANIATLTGEPLYNAVHAQCIELVGASCPNAATKTMVVSAYGMYIENDCSLLISGLDKKLTAANSEIRITENEMGQARYENYNTHNSTSINDCIAQVRQDITSNMACGTDYVHCLDVTGRYLNIETGEPIYSAEFFELNDQTSLSGNILENKANTMFVARLNDMKSFAGRGLDTCRDISDEVWDEFMRQAITEIHQGQQDRIRQVKNECLTVINTCYDTQTKQLKDFSDTDEARLLGLRMELSEQMCQEKLDACSNLYGGGPDGLAALVTAMYDIVSQQIAQECQNVLRDYAKKLCAVPSNDTLHTYPYACRTYFPGDRTFAQHHGCNTAVTNQGNETTNESDGTTTVAENSTSQPCPQEEQGKYVGSLHHKLVRYARQMCMRPSATDSQVTPDIVLQDVNVVMDEIRSDMLKALASECERLDGEWDSTPKPESETGTDQEHEDFYFKTNTSKKWGFCSNTDTQNTQ